MRYTAKRNFFSFRGDPVILIVVIFLSLLSITAVYTASGRIGSQLINFAICFGAIFLFYKIDYRMLSSLSLLFLIVGFVLLIITLVAGDDKQRAIIIFGQEFQTLYLIGFLVIFYIAKFLATHINKEEELTHRELFFLFSIITLFCGGFALSNFSTTMLLALSCIVVLFVANMKMKRIALLIGIFMIFGAIYLVSPFGRSGTVIGRIEYFLGLKKETDNSVDIEKRADYGRQIVLAKAAIARSAWLPAGPGQGVIKDKLPQRDTDYVFATFVEELGIGIGVLIILLYMILFFRTMQIARKSEGFFGRVLAIGIGFWITCQALVHIGVNCALLPSTGQTLPFISRGGASLLFSGMMIGILLNISKNVEYPKIQI